MNYITAYNKNSKYGVSLAARISPRLCKVPAELATATGRKRRPAESSRAIKLSVLWLLTRKIVASSSNRLGHTS